MRYVPREKTICEYAAGRSVLHLGCVGDAPSEREALLSHGRSSLHMRLTSIARSVVGIDLNAEAVALYREAGLFDNILVGDVEEIGALDLGRFERVVAGDIIEHVANPGRMLEGVRNSLLPNGKLILTTPNPFGLPANLRHLLGRYSDNPEHVMAFTDDHLRRLLDRFDMEIERLDSCYQSASAHGLSFFLGWPALKMMPKVGGTLIAVARRN